MRTKKKTSLNVDIQAGTANVPNTYQSDELKNEKMGQGFTPGKRLSLDSTGTSLFGEE